MPINDKRQAVADYIYSKIQSGERLSEDDVKHLLYTARDFALMYSAHATVMDQEVSKPRMRMFNSFQNAVERYELAHVSEAKQDQPGEIDGINIGYEMSLPVPKVKPKSEIEA